MSTESIALRAAAERLLRQADRLENHGMAPEAVRKIHEARRLLRQAEAIEETP